MYNQLTDMNLCKTRYEFSSYWLNRSKRYYSSVINENRGVSIDPLMNAIARLRLLATECQKSRHALLIEKDIKLNAIRTDMEIRVTRCITEGLQGSKWVPPLNVGVALIWDSNVGLEPTWLAYLLTASMPLSLVRFATKFLVCVCSDDQWWRICVNPNVA